MMSKEAMKLALEALEYIHEGANNQGPHTGISWRCVSNKAEPAITALRQALANKALDKMAENARELGLAEQPAQQEPVATITITQRGPIRIIDNNFDDCVRDWPDGEYKLYTSSQPAQRKPLPYNKEDMKDLDVNQRLAFKLGWKSAEEAHGIKENT